MNNMVSELWELKLDPLRATQLRGLMRRAPTEVLAEALFWLAGGSEHPFGCLVSKPLRSWYLKPGAPCNGYCGIRGEISCIVC